MLKIDFLQVMQLQKIETAVEQKMIGFDVAQYSDATLTILSSKNNPVLEVRFRDLYPTSLSVLSYDQQCDTSYLTVMYLLVIISMNLQLLKCYNY